MDSSGMFFNYGLPYSNYSFEGSQHNSQLKFNPYSQNGGCVAAIAGADFVVIGADTRLSLADYSLIFTREKTKLTLLTDKTVLGITGCMADAIRLTDVVKNVIRIYQFDQNRQISTPAAAQMISTVLYSKRFFPYFTQSIVAGLDENGEGWVYSFDTLGHFEKLKNSAAGTSSEQIQPLLDNQLSSANMPNAKQEPITIEKAKVVMKDAFISAAERDIQTGDSLEILTITASGIQEERFDLRKD